MIFENLPKGIDTASVISCRGALKRLGPMFSELFPKHTAVIIADGTTWTVAGKYAAESLDSASVRQTAPFIITNPSLSAEWRFEQQIESFLKNTDAIPVAVGSGVINDLTKLASFRLARPYLCVGTVASSDGYAAFGASIIRDGAKRTFDCSAPYGILMDSDVIFNAPKALTVAGYADLMAKITAGADWIVADAYGAEKLDGPSFEMSQCGLRSVVEEFDIDSEDKVERLVGGLLRSGFAMQIYRSSRPASGMEHLFSHLWDVQGHTFNGRSVSHGFQVGIGVIVSAAFYEMLLSADISNIDTDKCVALQLSWEEELKRIENLFADIPDMIPACVEQTKLKKESPDELRERLRNFQVHWPSVKEELRSRMITFKEAKSYLKNAGAPYLPEQIGISKDELWASCLRLPYLRNRFTIVDLAIRFALFEDWLEKLFSDVYIGH